MNKDFTNAFKLTPQPIDGSVLCVICHPPGTVTTFSDAGWIALSDHLEKEHPNGD